MLKKCLIALVFLSGSFVMMQAPALHAQQAAPAASTQTVTDQDVDLMRQDLRSKKKQLIAANLPLTDTEAEKFWPVYDQYTAETTKLNDARYALIKEYAQTYNTMTDVQADNLTRRANALDESFVQLRGKYIPVVRKVLPAKKTAMFFQLDRRIALMMDLQLASMIPMVKQAAQ